jgi:hypothetical protein
VNLRRLQFSVRTLFVATTAIAVVVFVFAHYRRAAVGCLSISFPVLLPAVMAFLRNHVSLSARFILGVVGALFLVFVAGCWLQTKPGGDESDWMAIALMVGIGFFFLWILWSVAPMHVEDHNQSAGRSSGERD